MVNAAPETPEFSRPIELEGLKKATRVRIEADAGECAALARRFALDGLDSLTADIMVTPRRGARDIRVEGTFEAQVRQTCSVTLVPLETRLEGALDILYSIDIQDEYAEIEDEDTSSLTGPEPWPQNGLDLGELVAEALGLEIDPFPRAPEVEFTPQATSVPEEEVEPARPNPFASLQKLKESGDFDPEKSG